MKCAGLQRFRQLINSTPHCVLNDFEWCVVEFFNEAQNSRQQVGALKKWKFWLKNELKVWSFLLPDLQAFDVVQRDGSEPRLIWRCCPVFHPFSGPPSPRQSPRATRFRSCTDKARVVRPARRSSCCDASDAVDVRCDGFRCVAIGSHPIRWGPSDCGGNVRAEARLADNYCHPDNNPESSEISNFPAAHFCPTKRLCEISKRTKPSSSAWTCWKEVGPADRGIAHSLVGCYRVIAKNFVYLQLRQEKETEKLCKSSRLVFGGAADVMTEASVDSPRTAADCAGFASVATVHGSSVRTVRNFRGGDWAVSATNRENHKFVQRTGRDGNRENMQSNVTNN